MTLIVERQSDLPKDGSLVQLKVYRDPRGSDVVFGFVAWIGPTGEERPAVYVETDFAVPVREAFLQAAVGAQRLEPWIR
jgi:hypothetical protein